MRTDLSGMSPLTSRLRLTAGVEAPGDWPMRGRAVRYITNLMGDKPTWVAAVRRARILAIEADL